MQLALSVDVEEEGLFSGRYPRQPLGVENVGGLPRLLELCRELEIRPTLLCTHAVACDERASGIVAAARETCGAELGLHLHPWGTPPFDETARREPADPESLPPGLLAAKLETLAAGHRQRFGRAPVSFRMGRFEIGPRALSLLPALGIGIDTSIVPLYVTGGRFEHFLAPRDPYRLATSHGLLEVPLTQQPLSSALARFVWHASQSWPAPARARWLGVFRYVGVVGLAPAWFSLPAMQHAARLHQRRGGRLLHLFLHSSDLVPGGSPAAASAAAVERLYARLQGFLEWMRARRPIESVTLSDLAAPWP